MCNAPNTRRLDHFTMFLYNIPIRSDVCHMIDEDGLLGLARALDQDTLAQIHDAYYGASYRYISVRDDDLQTM
jgi:hypothetical protein